MVGVPSTDRGEPRASTPSVRSPRRGRRLPVVTAAPARSGPLPESARPRRPRLLRRLRRVLAAMLALLVVVAGVFGVAWVGTPGVDDAQQRVSALLAEH